MWQFPFIRLRNSARLGDIDDSIHVHEAMYEVQQLPSCYALLIDNTVVQQTSLLLLRLAR